MAWYGISVLRPRGRVRDFYYGHLGISVLMPRGMVQDFCSMATWQGIRDFFYGHVGISVLRPRGMEGIFVRNPCS